MTPTYIYRAVVKRIIDGDTIVVTVDLGFRTSMEIVLRLYGLDAPELSTPEGKKLRETLKARLQSPITIRTFKDPKDKYGRWLAEIHSGETNINQWLLDNGLAKKL